MDEKRPELYRNGKWFVRENKNYYNTSDERFGVPYDIVHDVYARVQDAYNLEAAKKTVDELATRDLWDMQEYEAAKRQITSIEWREMTEGKWIHPEDD